MRPPLTCESSGKIQMMLDCFALSDKGCVRQNNEDYCLVKPEIGLFILADGMGGAKAGERASRLAVETVEEIVSGAFTKDSQTLLAAVHEANRRVICAAQNDPELDGMGTTLVAVLQAGTEFCIASVGDSRAYVLDESGLYAITEDQTWVNEVGRPLGIDEASLKTHPMRHVLTMAIGVGAQLAIKYYQVVLPPRSLLLICSDGLHGVVGHQLMEQILRNGAGDGSLEQRCQMLVEAAKRAGGPDNVTTVLVRAA